MRRGRSSRRARLLGPLLEQPEPVLELGERGARAPRTRRRVTSPSSWTNRCAASSRARRPARPRPASRPRPPGSSSRASSRRIPAFDASSSPSSSVRSLVSATAPTAASSSFSASSRERPCLAPAHRARPCGPRPAPLAPRARASRSRPQPSPAGAGSPRRRARRRRSRARAAALGLGRGRRRPPLRQHRRSEPPLPSADASSRRRAYSGSRSLSTARSGVAMKIDEYAPEPMPMSSANAKSFSVVAAEEEQRDDRQQRDERRRQRAADRLPERDVGDRPRSDARRISGMFSRMRSKMMIVS